MKKTMDEILSRHYAREFNIPYELACIISQRFLSYDNAKKFLFPELKNLHSPETLPDIERATREIIKGIKNGDDILIYTHDDPDGYTSAYILYQTLLDIKRKEKPQIYIYSINREKDGYILNPEVLKKYKDIGVKIIITVDFGISNKKNFTIAQDMALKLIVCDHHEINLTEFPVIAVDPKRVDSKYPFRELAGAGVTLKLCQSIYQMALGLKSDEFYHLKAEFLAVVMIGTLADRVMPLDENRILCYEGLKAFPRINKPWVKYFFTENHIGFPYVFKEIIPVLQSASLDDSQLGIDFFLTESSEKFVQVLERLKSIENERQKCVDSTFQLTLNIAKVYPNITIAVIPANTASSMSIKTNYLGAVASKLRDYFHKTAVLIMVRDGKCIGELRSNQINLFEFLNKIKELFLDFGGHRRAAGFSMSENNLDKFTEYATGSINVPLEQDREERRPEATLDKAKINLLEPLLPFGEGNPSPLLTDGVDLYTIDNRMNIIELGLWQT